MFFGKDSKYYAKTFIISSLTSITDFPSGAAGHLNGLIYFSIIGAEILNSNYSGKSYGGFLVILICCSYLNHLKFATVVPVARLNIAS